MWVWVKVCVRVSSSTKSRVCVCNGSDSGSANKSRPHPRDVCVFVNARSKVGMGVCVCVCHSSSPVYSYLCVFVCKYMHVNAAKRLQLHTAVILVLIVKYSVLKIVSYSHATTPCNLINKQSANSSTERKLPTVHTRKLSLKPLKTAARYWYRCYKFAVLKNIYTLPFIFECINM